MAFVDTVAVLLTSVESASTLLNGRFTMMVKCARCGYVGSAEMPWRQSMLATRPWQRRTNVVDVWLCDVCGSEIRDQ